MDDESELELQGFTPYLLNLAAEMQSKEFSAVYRDRYGMLRPEWRVLFHLGRYGPMTATEISTRGFIHKTKVSRAVRALEEKRFLGREISPDDRRSERLFLRPPGQAAFRILSEAARDHEAKLEQRLGRRDAQKLRQLLGRLIDPPNTPNQG